MALRSKSLASRIISSVPNNPHHLASPKSRCGNSAPSPAAASATHTSFRSDIFAPEPHTAPSGAGVIRRFLHQLGRNHAFALPLQGRLGLPTGDSLVEKLRGLGGKRAPILDALARPPIPPDIHDRHKDEAASVSAPAATNHRLQATEAVKERLRAVPHGTISYAELLHICSDECGGDGRNAADVARCLNDSGAVLVIGSVVFVRPEQVVQAIETAMAPHYRKLENHTGRHTTTTTSIPTAAEEPVVPTALSSPELRELEAQLAEIDTKAAAGARRELWAGLLLLMAQTVGFARLTFWELSWDVMEPVCFYVTSLYFMAGYAFFLRTDKDPSFEGVFQARFEARRRRLIRETGFRVHRYEELRRCQTHGGNVSTTLPPSMNRRACEPQLRHCLTWSPIPQDDASSSPGGCDCRHRMV